MAFCNSLRWIHLLPLISWWWFYGRFWSAIALHDHKKSGWIVLASAKNKLTWPFNKRKWWEVRFVFVRTFFLIIYTHTYKYVYILYIIITFSPTSPLWGVIMASLPCSQTSVERMFGGADWQAAERWRVSSHHLAHEVSCKELFLFCLFCLRSCLDLMTFRPRNISLPVSHVIKKRTRTSLKKNSRSLQKNPKDQKNPTKNIKN